MPKGKGGGNKYGFSAKIFTVDLYCTTLSARSTAAGRGTPRTGPRQAGTITVTVQTPEYRAVVAKMAQSAPREPLLT